MQKASKTEAKTNIILVENAEAGDTELSKLLAASKSFKIGRSSSWAALEYELRDGIYDVVILNGDNSIGESLFEINEKVKSIVDGPPAVILFGGAQKTSVVRKAFRCGFTDVLPGTVSKHEFENTIKYAVEVANLRKNEIRRVRQLERAAQFDSLTGLPNLFHFQKHVERLIESSKRRERRFSILFFNISNMEEVIAQFGTDAADRVLLTCAGRMRGSARGGETYGQFDNDTFFNVIENPDSDEEVDQAMDRLLESLSRQIDTDLFSLKPFIEVWISEFPKDGTQLAQLLEGAQTKTIGNDAKDSLPASATPSSGLEPASEATLRKIEDSADTMATPQMDGEIESPDEKPVEDTVVNPLARATNRRAHRRRRVLKRGALILNNGFSRIDCTIRDISEGGARIVTDSMINLPKHIELLVTESGEKYTAQTRWQKDRQSGLMFVH